MLSTRYLLLGLLATTTAVARPWQRPPAPKPECVVAHSWVNSNSHRIPQHLAEFSSYDLAFRKAIFNALPKSAQARLWHEQLRQYGHSRRLSATQRAFVLALDRRLESLLAPDNRAELNRVSNDARRVLGFELARQVIADLGGPAKPIVTTVARQISQSGCGCSTDSDWCNPEGLGCRSDLLPCEPSETGCGTFWQYSCDGDCF